MIKGADGYFSIKSEIPSSVREVSIGTARRENGSYQTLVTYQVK
jgi:hypothetical protein